MQLERRSGGNSNSSAGNNILPACSIRLAHCHCLDDNLVAAPVAVSISQLLHYVRRVVLSDNGRAMSVPSASGSPISEIMFTCGYKLPCDSPVLSNTKLSLAVRVKPGCASFCHRIQSGRRTGTGHKVDFHFFPAGQSSSLRLSRNDATTTAFDFLSRTLYASISDQHLILLAG